MIIVKTILPIDSTSDPVYIGTQVLLFDIYLIFHMLNDVIGIPYLISWDTLNKSKRMQQLVLRLKINHYLLFGKLQFVPNKWLSTYVPKV